MQFCYNGCKITTVNLLKQQKLTTKTNLIIKYPKQRG